MKKVIQLLAAAGVFALSSTVATAGVTVDFANPDNYGDMPWSKADRDTVLKDLTAHFTKLAATLPPDVDLKIEVLDIDMAGRLRWPGHLSHEIRVLNGGADWPTMLLRYSLEKDGKVIASGEDHLKNMLYLDRINHYASGDNLRYEKQMVDDWFKETIRQRLAAN